MYAACWHQRLRLVLRLPSAHLKHCLGRQNHAPTFIALEPSSISCLQVRPPMNLRCASATAYVHHANLTRVSAAAVMHLSCELCPLSVPDASRVPRRCQKLLRTSSPRQKPCGVH